MAAMRVDERAFVINGHSFLIISPHQSAIKKLADRGLKNNVRSS